MTSYHKPLRPVAARQLAIMLACLAQQAVFASDLICPETIPAAAITIAPMAGGWVALTPAAVPLTGVGFMQAPPSSLAELKPDSTKETARKLVVTWRFAGPYPEGKWISCDYAAGTVTLAKRLQDNVRQCAVTYEKPNKSSYSPRTVTCR